MKDLILNTKATIGKVLASENITVRYERVRTASFDVRGRVLRMPIFKDNISHEILDTFVGHEVGHALWTPLDEEVFSDSKLLPYVNVLEDIRIERMIKSKFPGLVKSFHKGYIELWEDGFFGVNEADFETLGFADRLNLHAKLGFDIKFTEVEEDLVRRAKSLSSWGEVVEFAKELRDFCIKEAKDGDLLESNGECESSAGVESESNCKKCYTEGGEEVLDGESQGLNTENNPVSEISSFEVQGDDNGDEGSDDTEDDVEDEEFDDNDDTDDEEFDDTEDDVEDDGVYTSSKPMSSPYTTQGESESADDLEEDIEIEPEIITQNSFDDSMLSVIHDSPKEIRYFSLKTPDLSDYIVSKEQVYHDFLEKHAATNEPFINLKRTEFEQFKKSNISIVNHMLKEFEMKKAAIQAKKAFTSRSGDLNMSDLFKYKYDDDIFLKSLHTPDGKSHGLIIIVDWSGSMDVRLKPTIQQVINLVLFCKKAGIAFDVYAFTDSYVHSYSRTEKLRLSAHQDEIFVSGVHLLHFLSSKQKSNIFNTALFHFFVAYTIYGRGYGLGGTPLHNTILLIPQLVEEFKKTTRSQVVHTILLTDGEAGDVLYTNGGYASQSQSSILVHKNRYYDIFSCERWSGTMVKNLLDFVKEVSDVKIIGFFLTKSSLNTIENIISRKEERQLTEKELEIMKNEYKNGYVTHRNCGYDELYYVKTDSSSFNLEDVDYFENVDTDDLNTATKGVKSALNKIGKGRNKQRVLMNRFIDIISKPNNIV